MAAYLNKMIESLRQVPGVQHVPTFHFFDDELKPVQCELLVSPQQGWAVATEHPEASTLRGGPISRGVIQLAAKICQEYAIEPDALILLARYCYPGGQDSVLIVRFAQGSRDLFEMVRFVGPSREVIPDEQLAAVVQELQLPESPAPGWRAVKS